MIPITPDQQKKIDAYIEILKEYNEHTNVYSKTAYDKLPFHIQDSITLASLCTKASSILDIGSGSGLPSVILAIMLPNTLVTAVDSKQRKTKFLFHVKQCLQLDNYTVITNDINQVIRSKIVTPDIVTAKAFASFEKIITICSKIKSRPLSILVPVSKQQVDAVKLENPQADMQLVESGQKWQFKDRSLISFEEHGCYYWKKKYR